MKQRIQHRSLPPLVALLACMAIATTVAQETNPVKLVKGVITDTKTKKPVDGGMVFAYIGSGNDPAVRSRINPKTGAYQMILSPGTQYRVRIEAPSYYGTDISYTSPTGYEYEETEKNFTVQALPIGSTIYSGKVFGKGTDKLSPSGDFNKAVEFMKSNRYTTLTVTVATESAPAKKPKKKKGKTTPAMSLDNQDAGKTLAARRTEALRSYLSARDIDTGRITWKTAAKITAKKKSAGADVSIELTGVDRESNQ
jgi:hypothetical protein